MSVMPRRESWTTLLWPTFVGLRVALTRDTTLIDFLNRLFLFPALPLFRRAGLLFGGPCFLGRFATLLHPLRALLCLFQQHLGSDQFQHSGVGAVALPPTDRDDASVPTAAAFRK